MMQLNIKDFCIGVTCLLIIATTAFLYITRAPSEDRAESKSAPIDSTTNIDIEQNTVVTPTSNTLPETLPSRDTKTEVDSNTLKSPQQMNLTASDIEWLIKDLGENEYLNPQHQLFVRVGGQNGEQYDLGIHTMDCNSGSSISESLAPKLSGEISRHECYWGGASTIFVVAKEGDRYAIKKADTGEGDYSEPVSLKDYTLITYID